MYEDARELVKEKRFASISELIRHALRGVLYPGGLTVNGFTPEFEDMVLEAEKEPLENDLVWETEADIDNYFRKLKNEIIHDKNKKGRRIQSSVKRVGPQKRSDFASY